LSEVVLLKGTDPVETSFKALKMIKHHLKPVLQKDSILVKPNYINTRHPSTGVTTDSRVVEGIVRFLHSNGGKRILIGEGSGFADTFKAFKVAGIDVIAERYNLQLIDLNKDDFVEVYPPNPLSLIKTRVAKTALESAVVSVPKLKLHRLATVTLSLKNMMGALASKGSMHRGRLSQKIADLVSVLKPSLSVIDGFIAGEGHETSGNPVQMDLVIAGTDPVAVDAVGASVMGVQPSRVKHIVMCQKKGLGTCDLSEISILGQTIEETRKEFRRSLSSRFLTHFG
jgi:uncharacterized protein (DUF362 family)